MPEKRSAPLTVTALATDDGMRLDRMLATHVGELTRSRIQALIRSGAVSRDRKTIGEPGTRVKPGEIYLIDVPPPEPPEPEGEQIPLDVVYEDDALIVIDKPPGLVVHPAAGHATGTLVNALIAHCGDSLSGIGGVKRPGIVHRLDRDTSGLLVVAKTDAAHKGLSEQFAAHGRDGRLERRYLALVWNVPVRPVGSIDAPLARSTQNRTKIAVTKPDLGRHAVTHYRLLESFADAAGKPVASLLELRLETGRTHQIRVHLAHIGHPVMGDATYGAHYKTSAVRLAQSAADALVALGRQALHATSLGFEHPRSGEPSTFERPPPPDMARLIEALRASPPPLSAKKHEARKARKPN